MRTRTRRIVIITTLLVAVLGAGLVATGRSRAGDPASGSSPTSPIGAAGERGGPGTADDDLGDGHGAGAGTGSTSGAATDGDEGWGTSSGRTGGRSLSGADVGEGEDGDDGASYSPSGYGPVGSGGESSDGSSDHLDDDAPSGGPVVPPGPAPDPGGAAEPAQDPTPTPPTPVMPRIIRICVTPLGGPGPNPGVPVPHLVRVDHVNGADASLALGNGAPLPMAMGDGSATVVVPWPFYAAPVATVRVAAGPVDDHATLALTLGCHDQTLALEAA